MEAEEIKKILITVMKENPLEGVYESDARYIWPIRWEELQRLFGVTITTKDFEDV